MELTIPFGNQTKRVRVELPASQVVVAQSENPAGGDWPTVVGACLGQPVGARPVREEHLAGKRVAIITDDWGRPTPASEVVPLLLREVHAAGAQDDDITFITASGMHNPMSREELELKLGADIVARYRCLSHDGGDWDNLRFVGISPKGTPVWVNRYVAEADYTIAVGRIFLHIAYGYEGGYKMILPGVSGFDTIVRDHSFNFSADSVEGIHDNPSRAEADAVGRMVGIDFLINAVMNAANEPVRAFCGEPMQVHQRGIEYGDHHVWGAEVSAEPNVVLCSPGSGSAVPTGYDRATLYRAARVAKPRGTVIYLTSQETALVGDEAQGKADDRMMELDLKAFQEALRGLEFFELIRLHERRNWRLPEREIQWRIKALRSEFYERRRLRVIAEHKVVLTPEPDEALRAALAEAGPGVRLLVLPEGRTTLPKAELYCAPRA